MTLRWSLHRAFLKKLLVVVLLLLVVVLLLLVVVLLLLLVVVLRCSVSFAVPHEWTAESRLGLLIVLFSVKVVYRSDAYRHERG